MQIIRAFCFATGVIGFGADVPANAIEIAQSYSERHLKNFIEVKARHAYDGKTLLVPGVPEAENEKAAGNALGEWLRWIGEDAHWAVAIFVMDKQFTAEEIATAGQVAS